MKFTEIPKEKARAICKKQKAHCETCPLRRWDEERNKLLFCYYIIREVLDGLQDEIVELELEEPKYINEETLQEIIK